MKGWGFLLILLLGSGAAQAQYFAYGKNRVQYAAHPWHYLQSAHFDVYYYEADRTGGGAYLADAAARAAEDAYAELRALFDYDLQRRVPLLIYPSHNAFAVTNAVDLPTYSEGIGGVTELFKNRVAVPFTGDWRDFRRVLHHELVHAVVNDLYYGGSIQSIIRNNIQLQIPLWFNEGLAEYAAQGWDTQSDLYVRDAILHDYLAPIPYLGGYFAYRGGQGVFDYLAAQYGREKITEILQRMRVTRSAELAIRQATGLGVDELSTRWHDALKAVYYPELAARENLDQVGRALVTDRNGGYYNTSPALAPQGDRVAFLTAKDGLFDVYLVETSGNRRPRKLLDGQTTPQFESLRILTPGLSWNPTGERLAVAVKSGEGDAIALVDVDRGRVHLYRIPDLDAVVSVAWSPDGSRIAFSGTRGPQSDIYVLDLETRRTTNYTHDLFSDHQPAWRPDGRALAFHSDRGDHLLTNTYRAPDFDILAHDFSQHDVYLLDLDRPARLTRLTFEDRWDDTNAAFGDDPDRVLFVSDRNGIPNLYERHLPTGRERPLTDLAGGVMQASLARNGGRVALVALKAGVPSIYVLRQPFERRLDRDVLPPNVWAQRNGSPDRAPAHAFDIDTYTFGPAFDEAAANVRAERGDVPFEPVDATHADGSLKPKRYKLLFTPDLVYGQVGYDALFGVQSYTQMRFSDMLGNHRISLATNLLVDLRNSDYLLAYEYRPRRTDYTVQVYHLARELADFSAQRLLRYRNYGLAVGASYPLDKFRRVDGALSVLGVSLTDLSDLGAAPRTRTFLFPSLTYTKDATVPGFLYPQAGRRYAVSLAGSPGLGVAFATLLGDARQYVGLGYGYGLAFRASGGLSVGPQAQRFYAAGVENWFNPRYDRLPIEDETDFVFATPVLPLRGYGYNAGNRPGTGSSTAFALLNAEARMPLVAALLPGPLPLLPLYNLQAAAFTDVGTLPDGRFNVWRTDAATGERRFDDVLIGVGVGLRTIALGVPLRFDWAWPYDGQRLGDRLFYFSLGLDF